MPSRSFRSFRSPLCLCCNHSVSHTDTIVLLFWWVSNSSSSRSSTQDKPASKQGTMNDVTTNQQQQQKNPAATGLHHRTTRVPPASSSSHQPQQQHHAQPQPPQEENHNHYHKTTRPPWSPYRFSAAGTVRRRTNTNTNTTQWSRVSHPQQALQWRRRMILGVVMASASVGILGTTWLLLGGEWNEPTTRTNSNHGMAPPQGHDDDDRSSPFLWVAPSSSSSSSSSSPKLHPHVSSSSSSLVGSSPPHTPRRPPAVETWWKNHNDTNPHETVDLAAVGGYDLMPRVGTERAGQSPPPQPQSQRPVPADLAAAPLESLCGMYAQQASLLSSESSSESSFAEWLSFSAHGALHTSEARIAVVVASRHPADLQVGLSLAQAVQSQCRAVTVTHVVLPPGVVTTTKDQENDDSNDNDDWLDAGQWHWRWRHVWNALVQSYSNHNKQTTSKLVGPRVVSFAEWTRQASNHHDSQRMGEDTNHKNQKTLTSLWNVTHVVYVAPRAPPSSSREENASLSQSLSSRLRLVHLTYTLVGWHALHQMIMSSSQTIQNGGFQTVLYLSSSASLQSQFHPDPAQWLPHPARSISSSSLSSWIHVQLPPTLSWTATQPQQQQQLLRGWHVVGALVAALQVSSSTGHLFWDLSSWSSSTQNNQNHNNNNDHHNARIARSLGGWTVQGPCEWCPTTPTKTTTSTTMDQSHVNTTSSSMSGNEDHPPDNDDPDSSTTTPFAPLASCASECASSSSSCIPSPWPLDLTRELTADCTTVLYTTVKPPWTNTHHHDPQEEQPTAHVVASLLRVKAEYPTSEETTTNNNSSSSSTSAPICNVAFVSRTQSPLVEWVLSRVPNEQLANFGVQATDSTTHAQGSGIHEQTLDKLNGRLLYRGWILVWPLSSIEGPRPLTNLDWMTVKLTPGRFLAESVQQAVYVSANGGSHSASKHYHHRTDATTTNKNATVIPKATVLTLKQVQLLVDKLSAPAQEWQLVHHKSQKIVVPPEPPRRAVLVVSQLAPPHSRTATTTTEPHGWTAKDAVKYLLGLSPKDSEPPGVKHQRDVFHAMAKWLNPSIPHGVTPASTYHMNLDAYLVSTSVVVQDLKFGHELRCEWYRHHLPFVVATTSSTQPNAPNPPIHHQHHDQTKEDTDSPLDALTLAHVLSLQNLQRRRALQEPDDHALKHVAAHGLTLQQLRELAQVHHGGSYGAEEWMPLLRTNSRDMTTTTTHQRYWAWVRYQFPVLPWNWDIPQQQQQQQQESYNPFANFYRQLEQIETTNNNNKTHNATEPDPLLCVRILSTAGTVHGSIHTEQH